MTDAVGVALVSAAVTIVGLWFQDRAVDKKFKHQQAIDAAARAEIREDTKALATHATEIKKELKENTKMTGLAYNAANNFEMKLEKLARVFDSVHTDREVTRQLAEIADLAKDTNQTVQQEIQPTVAEIKDMVVRDGEAG